MAAFTTGDWVEIATAEAAQLPQEYATVILRMEHGTIHSGFRVNQYSREDDGVLRWVGNLWMRTGDAALVEPKHFAHVLHWSFPNTKEGDA